MRCAFPPYKDWLHRSRAREIEKDQDQPIEIPGFWSSEAAKSSQHQQNDRPLRSPALPAMPKFPQNREFLAI